MYPKRRYLRSNCWLNGEEEIGMREGWGVGRGTAFTWGDISMDNNKNPVRQQFQRHVPVAYFAMVQASTLFNKSTRKESSEKFWNKFLLGTGGSNI